MKKTGRKPDIITQAVQVALEKCDGDAYAAMILIKRRLRTIAFLKKGRVEILTAEYVKSRISYCQETGIFRWLSGRSDRIGEIAGKGTGPYAVITLRSRNYMAHRLAWLIMTGKWPEFFIDHINGCSRDNRWANLREATQSQNIANSKDILNKYSGLPRGVRDRGKGRLRFRAYLIYQGKTILLGSYETAQEAGESYARGALKYFGEFAYSKDRAA